MSLALIDSLRLRKDSQVIDVGGGASTLVDDLIERGYTNISVIDISGKALDIAKSRLGQASVKATWIEDDILQSNFNNRKYDLWHDRAVFHFLTSESERNQYKLKIYDYLKKGGFAILSVFADDGPEKCSGLTIRRHRNSELEEFMGSDFELVTHSRTKHQTPTKTDQNFINMIFKRK